MAYNYKDNHQWQEEARQHEAEQKKLNSAYNETHKYTGCTGITIPRFVLDIKEITTLQKYLLSLILAYGNSGNGFRVRNRTLAAMFNAERRTIQKAIQDLAKKGYITTVVYSSEITGASTRICQPIVKKLDIDKYVDSKFQYVFIPMHYLDLLHTVEGITLTDLIVMEHLKHFDKGTLNQTTRSEALGISLSTFKQSIQKCKAWGLINIERLGNGLKFECTDIMPDISTEHYSSEYVPEYKWVIESMSGRL